MVNQLTLNQLSANEFLELAKKKKRVAVFREFTSKLDPSNIYYRLTNTKEESSFFEITEENREFTFLGFNPFITFKTLGDTSLINFKGQTKTDTRHPIQALKDFFEEFRCAEWDNLPHLAGSFIGFLSYDAVRFFEKLPTRHLNKIAFPEFFFQLYETSIVFDKNRDIFTICIVVDVSNDPSQDYQNAVKKIDQILHEKLVQFKDSPKKQEPQFYEPQPDVSDEEFLNMIKKAKDYIIKGDAFQIVLSRTFTRPYTRSPYQIFESLRKLERGSPLLFLLNTKEFCLIGASPEILVSSHGTDLEIMPIAGTRPRGEDEESIREELLSNEKECAEHAMLVDLARNDLGAVSAPNSVKVKDYKMIQLLSHVMHIVSRVKGTRKDKIHILDVLKAAFPAGTLTGAPKIRAMQIIDELEISYRGFYGGGVCIIDNKLDLDSYIMIRTALLKDGEAKVRAGAGIVYDSDPQMEANETRHKSQAILKAINSAEEAP